MLHLRLLEKNEDKPKTSRRREKIKIWAEINEIESQKNHRKNQQNKKLVLSKVKQD
jgi:hypothetical protein